MDDVFRFNKYVRNHHIHSTKHCDHIKRYEPDDNWPHMQVLYQLDIDHLTLDFNMISRDRYESMQHLFIESGIIYQSSGMTVLKQTDNIDQIIHNLKSRILNIHPSPSNIFMYEKNQYNGTIL